MKRLLFVLVALLAAVAAPAMAQDGANIITLNDATPAVDVVITLPPDSTGTVSLNMAMVAVTLKDSSNAVVFLAADPRLHALELNIAPNSGTHTLTIERLPGTAEAYVTVVSLPSMTMSGQAMLVDSTALGLNQQLALTIDPSSPGGSATVAIPSDTVGLITATFPGTSSTTQVIDSSGMVVAQSANGHVDGMNLVLDAGSYQFTLLSSALTSRAVVGLRAVRAEEGGFTVLKAPESPAVVANPCNATITVSSSNLRSGPGTGYSVLGYGYRDETFAVGGINPSDSWVVIGTDDGSAWIARSNIKTEGTCDNLTVFNIPTRNAQPAPIVITTSASPQGSVVPANSAPPSRHDDDDDDHDDDDREDDDDD